MIGGASGQPGQRDAVAGNLRRACSLAAVRRCQAVVYLAVRGRVRGPGDGGRRRRDARRLNVGYRRRPAGRERVVARCGRAVRVSRDHPVVIQRLRGQPAQSLRVRRDQARIQRGCGSVARGRSVLHLRRGRLIGCPANRRAGVRYRACRHAADGRRPQRRERVVGRRGGAVRVGRDDAVMIQRSRRQPAERLRVRSDKARIQRGAGAVARGRAVLHLRSGRLVGRPGYRGAGARDAAGRDSADGRRRERRECVIRRIRRAIRVGRNDAVVIQRSRREAAQGLRVRSDQVRVQRGRGAVAGARPVLHLRGRRLVGGPADCGGVRRDAPGLDIRDDDG